MNTKRFPPPAARTTDVDCYMTVTRLLHDCYTAARTTDVDDYVQMLSKLLGAITSGSPPTLIRDETAIVVASGRPDWYAREREVKLKPRSRFLQGGFELAEERRASIVILQAAASIDCYMTVT